MNIFHEIITVGKMILQKLTTVQRGSESAEQARLSYDTDEDKLYIGDGVDWKELPKRDARIAEAEALEDGANTVTAAQARSHIDSTSLHLTSDQNGALDANASLNAGNQVVDQNSLNTHTGDFALHLTSDQNDGLDGANEPITALNPVIVTSDIYYSGTVYVDDGGDDGTGDGSIGNPFLTIGGALAFLDTKVVTGPVTIHLNAGTFTTSSSIVVSKPYGQHITLEGSGSGSTTLSCTGGSQFALHFSRYGVKRLTGMTITCSDANMGIRLDETVSIQLISDVICTDCTSGIFLNYKSNIGRISSCSFTSSTIGIDTRSGSKIGVVTSCTFENGTVGTPAGTGIFCNGGNVCSVTGCTFNYNTTAYDASYGGEICVTAFNTLTGNTTDYSPSLSAIGAGSITYSSGYGRILEIE